MNTVKKISEREFRNALRVNPHIPCGITFLDKSSVEIFNAMKVVKGNLDKVCHIFRKTVADYPTYMKFSDDSRLYFDGGKRNYFKYVGEGATMLEVCMYENNGFHKSIYYFIGSELSK